METDEGIINNNFNGLEVHAIPISSGNFDHHHQTIDLTSFDNIQVEQRKILHPPTTSELPQPPQNDLTLETVVVYDKPEYVRNVDKHLEVLKSAKSLFSKRTLTLYHWMYPTIPKQQLKANVAAAWENLPVNEKHFYISQVLGKFGYPTTSLMLNPQLRKLKTASNPHPITITNSPSQLTPSTNLMKDWITAVDGHQQTKRLSPSDGVGASIKPGHHSGSSRSLLLPQYQPKTVGSNEQVMFGVSQYQQAEFVEVVKEKSETGGQAGGTAIYEIRLGPGTGPRVPTNRIMKPTSSNSGVVVDEERYMANILVPASMSMCVQNAGNSARGRTKDRAITRRRARAQTIRRKPVKKEIDEQYVTVEVDDEFPDDPELRQELQQFESTLSKQI